MLLSWKPLHIDGDSMPCLIVDDATLRLISNTVSVIYSQRHFSIVPIFQDLHFWDKE